MRNYFSIQEFIIAPHMRGDGGTIPTHVADKIIQHHLPILNPMRAQLGTPLIISQHSGYRPVQWELDHGRDGTSQHTFKGKGAVDLTCRESSLHHLGDLLAENDYSRVAWYPDHGFYHADFKDYQLGKRLYVVQNGIWKKKDYRTL